MGNIWTDRAKYQTWLDVEVAACEANFQLGHIPLEGIKQIRKNAAFEPERILQIEAKAFEKLQKEMCSKAEKINFISKQ